MSQPRKAGWLRRNWVWVVPVTFFVPVPFCCGLGLLALIIAAFPMAIKSSDVYQEALARAKKNNKVQATIGTPIQEGFFATGNINVSGTKGNADLAIPISGPKGSATVYAVARKEAGKWTFSTLDVVVDGGGNRINLLEKD